MDIRELTSVDFDALMALYTHLHDNPIPDRSEKVMQVWDNIMSDKSHHIIGAFENDMLVSSCVCVIIPNLTHGQMPYALVENVVTHAEHRCKGYAKACLDYAKAIADQNGCYKIMLMTGSKQDSTLRFYERAGYNKNDKTAFIQWL